MGYPVVIQGGMGAGISSWQMAKAVSQAGALGVVSGTALDMSLARKLQTGDPSGDLRRALQAFPIKEMAERVLNRYFIDGGKAKDSPFKPVTMFTINPAESLMELNIVGNFVEVWLAKEGHDKPIGINYLEKIQLPNPSAIYGAMLGGIDYVLMGAGIPREIPGILDKLKNHEDVTYKINVEGGTPDDDFKMRFSPMQMMEQPLPELKRPQFLAIITSAILALTLFKKSTGKVDGFIIEGPLAGGHNAPPRGALTLDDAGEPIYGEKDFVDLKKIAKLGLPYWLAGSYGTPTRVKEAVTSGATGIQAGTCFSLCKESGLTVPERLAILKKVDAETLNVKTDPFASPTGFPFKVLSLEGTNSEEDVYKARKRICDLGYLRHPYKKEDGKVGYRCPSEPEEIYIKKGGTKEETKGRKCLCNSLMANMGLGQVQKDGYQELPLITAGKDYSPVKDLLEKYGEDYTATDVVHYLTSQLG